MKIIKISKSMGTYCRHNIYCDLNYKSLISIAADYFVSLGYYDYVSEEKFKNNKKIYNYYNHANFSVVYAKSLIELSGSVNVSSENLKGKYSKGELKMKDLPLKVQQRFKNMPNILTIDLHKCYYKTQVNLVEELSKKLRKIGYITYDDCFNGQLLSIYETIKDEETKIASIHDLVYEYFNANNLPRIDLLHFHTDLSLILSNLCSDGIKALQTAEYLYQLECEIYDYSPIVIEYCKVIEIELNDKVLRPLKSHFQDLNSKSIITSNSIKKLKSFVFSSDDKSLELGTFAFILEKIITENINDLLASKIKEIIEELPFKLNLKTIIEEIFYLTRNYRNKAAHKSILTRQDMIDCRTYVLGDNLTIGLIGRIVSIG
jgi:hypothetical protein